MHWAASILRIRGQRQTQTNGEATYCPTGLPVVGAGDPPQPNSATHNPSPRPLAEENDDDPKPVRTAVQTGSLPPPVPNNVRPQKDFFSDECRASVSHPLGILKSLDPATTNKVRSLAVPPSASTWGMCIARERWAEGGEWRWEGGRPRPKAPATASTTCQGGAPTT